MLIIYVTNLQINYTIANNRMQFFTNIHITSSFNFKIFNKNCFTYNPQCTKILSVSTR